LYGQLYEVNAQGKTRFTRKFFSTFVNKSPGGAATPRWKTKIGDTVAPIGLALLIPSSPETVGKIIDDIYEKRYLSADRYSGYDVFEEKRRLAQMLRPLRGIRFLTHFPCLETLELPGFHRLYMHRVATRRRCRILIGLRKYKNRHGHWPASLKDIESLVPAVAFIDPISGGEFDYQLTNGGFKLRRKVRTTAG
jgi:hypothetical protein